MFKRNRELFERLCVVEADCDCLSEMVADLEKRVKKLEKTRKAKSEVKK